MSSLEAVEGNQDTSVSFHGRPAGVELLCRDAVITSRVGRISVTPPLKAEGKTLLAPQFPARGRGGDPRTSEPGFGPPEAARGQKG